MEPKDVSTTPAQSPPAQPAPGNLKLADWPYLEWNLPAERGVCVPSEGEWLSVEVSNAEMRRWGRFRR